MYNPEVSRDAILENYPAPLSKQRSLVIYLLAAGGRDIIAGGAKVLPYLSRPARDPPSLLYTWVQDLFCEW